MQSLITAVVQTLVLLAGMALATWILMRRLENEVRPVFPALQNLERSVDNVIAGQRLATIIDFQGADLLKVTPDDFEPNRERLKTALLRAIKKPNSHFSPETWAYGVVNESGLDLFLGSKSRGDIQKAFARLRANGDTEGAVRFADEVMAQL